MAFVVKVKYDGTLRRFNVYRREDGSLDLSLNALRSKICELFKIHPNAEFVITYIDEDKDVITMADEDDVLDALHQGLSPLRLEVSLKSQNNRGSELPSQIGSSTPKKSSPFREHSQNVDSKVVSPDEMLKLVPEPLRKALMKCAKDPVVKAVASTPAVSEFMDGLIRFASAHLGPLSEGQQGPGTNGGAKINGAALSSANDTVTQTILNFQPAPPSLSVPSAPPICLEPYGNGLKRNSGFSENILRTFHRGVQCDGCGMSPIVGPRFKSTVKENYDLCCNCFFEMGNDSEYTRIDRALYRPPRFGREGPFHGGIPFHRLSQSHPFTQSATLSCTRVPRAGKLTTKLLGKLDCRFVQDVTILDGTLLAPGTAFTKIWRLRNNGTLPWPPQTQLVRVGGDELGAPNAVNIEIQEQGCPVDEELDAVVHFIAPMQPGRYASYWRLMAPSGQKFGQRVWVLIQVETPREDFLPRLMESLLTLKEHKQKDAFQVPIKRNLVDVDASSQIPNEKANAIDDKVSLGPSNVCTEAGSFSMVEQLGGKSCFIPAQVIDVSTQAQEAKVCSQVQGADSCTQVQGASISVPVMPSALGPIYSTSVKTVPICDGVEGHVTVSVTTPSLAGAETHSLVSSASYGATKEQASAHSVAKGTPDANEVEQFLLDELEEMGFSQRKLNAEVLRKHKYDLQETLDYLCGAAEWDPILDELQEMGFCDLEMNKRLLLKNDGSVKRVVLDLLSAENAASSVQSSLSGKGNKN